MQIACALKRVDIQQETIIKPAPPAEEAMERIINLCGISLWPHGAKHVLPDGSLVQAFANPDISSLPPKMEACMYAGAKTSTLGYVGVASQRIENGSQYNAMILLNQNSFTQNNITCEIKIYENYQVK